MTLPSAASESIFPDADDRGEPRSRGRSAQSSVDYQPTEADLEALAILNADSFLPRDLPFHLWLAEKARQTALLDDERSRWLASRIDELASQARFLGANDPATFTDRDEVLVGRNGSGRRGFRRPWIGPAVASIHALADHLATTTPELAAILRRDLRMLEHAAGGAR